MKNLLFLILLLFFSAPIEAQSIINQALKGEGPIDTFHTPNISGCGHYTLMENKNMNIPNYIDLMNGKMMEINQTLKQQNSLRDRKSTRLNSSHVRISYAVFCLKKKSK